MHILKLRRGGGSALLASLLLLCMAMGAALGGGLYEGFVLTPIWSSAPPGSFAIIRPDTGVPLQTFWIPVHAAITITLLAALGLGWRRPAVRRLLLIGLCAYAVMRVWSFAYFIPEMLAFQDIPVDGSATVDLSSRVERWTTLTWLRMPLDLIAATSFLFAFWSVRGNEISALRDIDVDSVANSAHA